MAKSGFPEGDELARLLPDYKLDGLIGSGSTSVVHKATHGTTGCSVAIKIISLEDIGANMSYDIGDVDYVVLMLCLFNLLPKYRKSIVSPLIYAWDCFYTRKPFFCPVTYVVLAYRLRYMVVFDEITELLCVPRYFDCRNRWFYIKVLLPCNICH